MKFAVNSAALLGAAPVLGSEDDFPWSAVERRGCAAKRVLQLIRRGYKVIN